MKVEVRGRKRPLCRTFSLSLSPWVPNVHEAGLACSRLVSLFRPRPCKFCSLGSLSEAAGEAEEEEDCM